MFSRSYRRSVISGFGLLICVMTALSACAGGGAVGTGVGAVPASVVASPNGAPVAAADPAVAQGPKASRAASSKVAHGASSAHATTGRAATAAPLGAGAKEAGAASAGVGYGVSDSDLESESASVQLQQLAAMKALGITSVRIDAGWYWIQAGGPNSFDWAALDQTVASVEQAGLSVDLDINRCPTWAAVTSEAGNQWAQPASAAAFGTFAGEVAARYAPQGVNYYEIWNEPNTQSFWLPDPDPAAYTADLKAAYTAIKAVAPSSVVISGGLAPESNTSTTYNGITFLEDMYADGAKGSFDALGDHPYSFPALPDQVESWSGWSQMDQTSPSLRSVMAANGDSAKKIWITEFGAPTSGPNSVGDSGQSSALAQAISQAGKLNWIGFLYIYTWEDESDDSADNIGFGLLNSDGSQKSDYAAVGSALATNG